MLLNVVNWIINFFKWYSERELITRSSGKQSTLLGAPGEWETWNLS